jgi:hypothetical protein
MRNTSLVVVAAVLLQACVMSEPVPQPPPPPPQPDLSSCHAVGLDGLIGQPVRLLPKHGAWSSLRVIRPGMMVTMEYSPTRLNARVDSAKTILSLNCG